MACRSGLQIADLVEEERAAVGQLELADALLQRAGERALLVAEQRALDELARNGGDVDRDERRVGIGRLAMQEAREQLLAGAAFAEDHDGGRKFRDLVHRFEHVLQAGARAGDEVAGGGVARRVLQRQHVAMQILPLAGVADELAQHVGIGVLRQEVIGAELDRADRAVDVRRRGGHDDLDQRKVFTDDLQKVDAAESRLRDVGDEDIDVLLVQQRQACLGGRGADDTVVAPQRLRQTFARFILPVDYENGLSSHGRSLRFKV